MVIYMKKELYPGIAFSPQIKLTNNIGEADTIIEVSDVTVFPPAPNLATIGTDENGETILYTAKTATALSGCQRGVEGTAKAWRSGDPIGRNFTAKDHNDLIAAVAEAMAASSAAQNEADAATKAAGDIRQRLSNPNLLDNWYFVDPINQRGQTTYTLPNANSYFIDRWFGARASIRIVDNGIEFIWDGSSEYGFIHQKFEYKDFEGKILTCSIIVDENLYSWTTTPPSDINETKNDSTCDDIGFLIKKFTDQIFGICVLFYSTEKKIIKAAKLELGDTQTLAHQDEDGNWVLNDPPPDKMLELAKCQRYQVSGELYGLKVMQLVPGYAGFFFPLTVPLRSNAQLEGTIQVRKMTEHGWIDSSLPTNMLSAYNNGIYAYVKYDANIIGAGADVAMVAKIPNGSIVNANL